MVSSSGLNKTNFANAINISQPFLSQICLGAKTPSERTLLDICRTFNVSEDWLRTGKGEMFVLRDRSELIIDYIGKLVGDENAELQRTIISIMASLPAELWQAAEECARKIRKEEQKKEEEQE